MADRVIPRLGEHPRIAGRGGLSGAIFALALVFACFTLSSTSYLAWLYRLMEYPSVSADGITMVGGYSFQALGIGVMCALIHWRPRLGDQIPFITAIAIHFACITATVLAKTLEGLIALGFCMNFLSGLVCAFYLQRLAQWAPRNRRGLAFGGGYACSIALTWMFSQMQGGSPLDATQSIIACAVLSLVAISLVTVSQNALPTPAKELHDSMGATSESLRPIISDYVLTQQPAEKDRSNTSATRNALDAHSPLFKDSANQPIADIVSLACITVVLMSLVKNVGFGFPSADLMQGVSLESSRLFYAAGLIIAGLIADASRKHAGLCCIAALVLPFGFIALASEPIPATILWAADYLFFGFFSVYRIVLFSDLAEDTECEHLTGFGLLFGRIGDALGTALWLALGSTLIALVAVATVLFAATVIAFYHLLTRLYPAQVAVPKTEQERFEEFAATYGVSIREREVLRLVLAERTNAEVASALFITEGTVKYHVHNLFKKTGCANRRELIAKYNVNAS